MPLFSFPCNSVNWVSVFNNLRIDPPAYLIGTDNLGKKWRREDGWEKVKEKNCAWKTNLLLLNQKNCLPKVVTHWAKWFRLPSKQRQIAKNTHLPTGKKFNYSQDYGHHELHMQAHTLYLPHSHGNDLKQISCSLSTIISQTMWGNSECSEKSEVERPGELTVPLSPLWKLSVFLWATLLHTSVGITSLVSLTEHLPKIGVFWYLWYMCSCITRSMCVLSRFSHVWLFVTLWTVFPPGSSVHEIL